MLEPAPGLQVTGSQASGVFAVFVDGLFRLDFAETDHWQIAEWNDLATDALVNLASDASITRVLFDPFYTAYGGNWYAVNDASGGTVTVVDQSPARAIIDTTIDYAPAGEGFEVHAVYTVYATGRIGISSTLTNTASVDRVLTGLEANYTTLSNTVPWQRTDLASGHATGFARTDGNQPFPNLLIVHHGPETVEHDSAVNAYWPPGGATMTPGQTIIRFGELTVAPGGLADGELATRADDALGPGLEVVQGGSAVGDGYDESIAAYVVDASGGDLDVRLTADRIRHRPAFEIRNYSASTWSIRLDGTLLAASDQPSGPSAHTFHETNAGTLVLVYLNDIPTAAGDAARTFEIRAQ
ncbi:MAG: hypothetical protein JRH11_26470 [Deltaproteobacteria bacterium]|nr:hypothetical protein [Deltaproteobacteria bacterium]